MIFKPQDLIWIRNVRHKEDKFLTYMEDFADNAFVLQWSKKFVSSNEALKPQFGDIIVLFQRHKGRTFFTHLVTPVDGQYIDFSKKEPDFPWGRRVTIVARAKDGIPVPRHLNLSSVNQGLSYLVKSIKTTDPLEEVVNWIWNAFLPYFLSDEEIAPFIGIADVDPSLEALEGTARVVLRQHMYRERASYLIVEKKHQAILQNKLFCECCNFNFAKVYPGHGENFIECHHRLPIHQGERITKLEDLALVCSNCHRMLHRQNKSVPGGYYTVEELSKLIHQ